MKCFAAVAAVSALLAACATSPAGSAPSITSATPPAEVAPAPETAAAAVLQPDSPSSTSAGPSLAMSASGTGPGESADTAVQVPADVPNEGVDFQNHWIFDHYGKFRRKKFAMGHAPGALNREHHYDVITFEIPDGSIHTVYFDMTDFWDEQVRQSKETPESPH